MSSIFTYDPDPPRVASPWLNPSDSPNASTPQPDRSALPSAFGYLADYGVTRLEAEPQDGPTEYKLHLLLRPRRTYISSSTGRVVSGSKQHEQQPTNQSASNESWSGSSSTKQSKQKRFESLTTQLLWRLQQSSPYHASSTSELVLPKLASAMPSVDAPVKPEKMLAGLEESRGALYEIGVSDDGTLVGLTMDEMDESLNNLRAMATSLGCNVEIIRMVGVGDCEWYDTADSSMISESLVGKSSGKGEQHIGQTNSVRHQEQLWVAEALVTPDLSSAKAVAQKISNTAKCRQTSPLAIQSNEVLEDEPSIEKPTTQQLRITLTGPTTSGKSSLLGTLSTATLDNGRGKSRLSLLKHRHEIESGVTSSVAQELIGYRNDEVINYASGNVSSWTDIHASTEPGRLLFVSDSAGHPRYRRTTARGLIGWAPHWTVLCVAADEGENAPSGVGGTLTAQEVLGTAGVNVDLTKAHLELCLKLEKPLAIVITKLDLATKASLRQTLSKILSAIKASGRTPSLLPPDPSKFVLEAELRTISAVDNEHIRNITDKFITGTDTGDLTSIVPIVLTSAAKGVGIRMLHSLMRYLPIPSRPTSNDFIGHALNPEQPACLFHIEDIFALPASYEPLASTKVKIFDSGVVVAGHLRFGTLSIGDKIVIGPFPADNVEQNLPRDDHCPQSSPRSFGGPFSNPSTIELARLSRDTVSASVARGEWHTGRIVSIRNLRLPVHTLEPGQVATVGIVFDIPDQISQDRSGQHSSIATPRIRKGMVLAIPSRHMIETGHTLQAASGFTASFEDSDITSVTVGSLVVVYIASIRGTARVLCISPHARSMDEDMHEAEDTDENVFGLDAGENDLEPEPVIFGSDGTIDVSLELITNREWIELGSQVLIMPGGGHGLYAGSERGEKGVAGLDGFVGKVIEVVD